MLYEVHPRAHFHNTFLNLILSSCQTIFYTTGDSYGNGFLKHNTNSGFVDMEEHRKTPQVFSAHSFYASNGTRLVADVQGVADLYTDPQVLSMDYRFGDGDLGPRGESNYC